MGERPKFLLRDLLPVATPLFTLLGVWLGAEMNTRGIERSVPLQVRTEQVMSAYAQYIATAQAPTATADTSARLRRAKAIISAYGSAEVVGALADIQAAVDALQATARAQVVASAIAAVATSETRTHLDEARTIIISNDADDEVALALECFRSVVIEALDLAAKQAEAERSSSANIAVSDALVAAVSAIVHRGDTYARFLQAKAIISDAGRTEVVDTLARLDTAVSAAMRTPHLAEIAQPGGALDAAVNEAIVSSIAAMRAYAGEEPVSRSHLAQIFGIPQK